MGSMLLIHSTRYQHAGTVFDGLVAVGCYVSFASLHRLPTVRSFGMAGFFAAGWGLLLAPFVCWIFRQNKLYVDDRASHLPFLAADAETAPRATKQAPCSFKDAGGD